MEKKLSVLIIEDSEDDALLAVRELKRGGYAPDWHRVETSEDLKKALKNNEWDLILSDYKMPRFTGLAALKIIQKSRSDVPFIIISGTIGEETAVKVMKAGAHDYIMKDKLALLMPAVERELREAKNRQRQKETEQALKENERFLQNVFDGIQDGISVLDKDLNIIRTNVWMEKMYESRMPLIGKKCYQVYQDREEICSWCPSIKARDTGSVHVTTAPYPSEENIEGWVDVSSFPLRDASGKIVGVIEHVKNVTDQKKAEQALKESEEKFRTLAEQSPNMIFINKIGRVVYTNKRAVDMMGYSKEEFYSPDFDFMTLIAPESKKIVREMFRLHKRGENVPPYEYDILTKRGDIIHAINSSQIIQYEGEPAILGVITDITIQKRAEEALKESEEKYRNLIEQSNDAIYLLFEDKFEVINQRFTDIFGYTLEETNHPDFNFRDLIAPESLTIIEDRMKRLAEGQSLEPIYEFTAVSKGGKPIECETGVTYIDYKGGIATQGIIRNITERKQAEELIRSSLNEKEILLKEIHHRVKNNLQIISSLLNLQADQLDDDRTLRILQDSRSRVHSMALVHERLYKSENFSAIDFQEYVQSMIKNLFQTYSTSNQVSLDLDIQDITLGIDTAIPCGLILNEMISNSLKHAFPEQSKGRIHISLSRSKKGYRIDFADDGVGLPENIDVGKAESLGLKLIQILTDQINGNLKVGKEKGTSYTITFKGEID